MGLPPYFENSAWCRFRHCLGGVRVLNPGALYAMQLLNRRGSAGGWGETCGLSALLPCGGRALSEGPLALFPNSSPHGPHQPHTHAPGGEVLSTLPFERFVSSMGDLDNFKNQTPPPAQNQVAGKGSGILGIQSRGVRRYHGGGLLPTVAQYLSLVDHPLPLDETL